MLLLVPFTHIEAAPLEIIVDTTSGRSTADGVLNAEEYGALSFFSTGSGNSFGGALGDVFGETSRIYWDSDINGGINLGLQLGGHDLTEVNQHAIAIYIDSVVGGFTDTTLIDDNADRGRGAVSGNGDLSGEAEVHFAAGFEADYALAIEENFASLFLLASGGSGTLTWIKSLALTPTTRSQQKEGEFLLSDIGLNPGDSFDFVSTLINADAGFRSNELHGHEGIVDGHIGHADFTFDNFNTFTSIPEPILGAPLFAALGALFTVWIRRPLQRRETID